MREFLVRGMIAAFISAAGVVGTHFWAKSRQMLETTSVSDPIAKLVASTNEVQRRPIQHLIWKSINNHEDLFSGEELRTATDAEAQVQFLGATVRVRLEGDSVIRIERIGKTLSLGFLKGNLFIAGNTDSGGGANGAAPSGDTFVVQSGDQKIAVGAAEVSIAKASAEAPLEIDVFKGEVKDLGTGKAPIPKAESTRIKILKPSPREAIYASPGTDANIAIEFQPIDPAYEVTAEGGLTHRDLSPMSSVAAVNGASGKIEVPMKPGRGYVKLVAKAADGSKAAMSSTAYRVEVRPRVPVALLEPESKKVIKPGEDKGDVVFRWANAGQLIDLKLEIGETADFAKPLYLHNVEGKSAHALVIENASGEFFWRVRGRLPGTEETIVSEARSFNLLPKTPPPLEPPKITGPDDSRSITLAEMRTNGLSFVWEQAKGADEYEIQVTGDGDLKKSETSALLGGRIQGLKPGAYKWQVVSKNAAGQVSPPSAPRTFVVEAMPVLAWTDKFAQVGKLIYKTARPELEIAWEKGPEQAVKWKLRLTGERQPASDKESWKDLDANRFQAKLDEPGAYQFEVIALDGAGEIVARSAQRSLAFEQAPPPGPPMLAAAEKEIQARDDGSLDVAWNKVEDAKEYELQLRASDGKVVKSERTSGNKSSFKKLKPGPYTIGLRSIDSLGRTGPESEPRSVRVPEYSEVRAPKIKKLNVK